MDESAPNYPLDTSPHVSDEIAQTTCYMCACRCGINVHLREGVDEATGESVKKVRYIEGNRDHPVNRGVLCAKGSAGIMQHYSPARLKAPMKRVGPRGSGQFEEISWDEALELATQWLAPLREEAPNKLAFFTGRDQSQSFTSLWAQSFGTPNYAAHGGFCSVNMATGGIYTLGGAFWEFGSPDWENTKLFMLFGVAEDHDSNPIKMGLGRLKERGAKTIAVNPVRTGYNAVADEWIGITPGTDGLFVLSLVHELVRTGKIDVEYLARYTNAAAVVVTQGDPAEMGLLARDAEGNVITQSSLRGVVDLGDGRQGRPVFELMVEKYLDPAYAPSAVAERCGIPASRIEAIAQELARVAFEEEIEIQQPWTDMHGVRHETMKGRPVAMHAMRGISAHSNGFQTCRAIHLLQLLLGSVEVPGGFRFKPPYPKPVSAHPKPHAGWTAGQPLDGPHLGFVRGPEDLLLEDDGVTPKRIDKAFSWDAPMSAHGLMHMVISNAHAGDPYPVDTLFLYMANMSWNSSMNTRGVMEMLEDKDPSTGEYKIPRIIYSDAYSSEMVAYADLVLPDTTYLERHDCISLLDRPISEADAACDAIRWPVVEPDRDVRGFQSVLCELGAKLGLPAFVNEDGSQKYQDYADYMVNHQRRPGVGPLSGWRGEAQNGQGRGDVNPNQIDRYIENGGFWMSHIPDEALYYKPFNKAYQDWAVSVGLFDAPQHYQFDLYSEIIAKFAISAKGEGAHPAPESHQARLQQAMDPMPCWYDALEAEDQDLAAYPYSALTQRPAAMYHSWGSQNAWLRQIHGHNPLYVPGRLMDEKGLQDGDWARVTSRHGEIVVPVARTDASNDTTLWTWNAIGKRKGAWNLDPDAPEAKKGFLLNHLIHELLPPKGDGLRWSNSDPITGQAAWFDLRVNIEKADAPVSNEPQPNFEPQRSMGVGASKDISFGEEWSQ